MKILYLLLLAAYYHPVRVISKSFHLVGNELFSPELDVQEDLQLTPKSDNMVVWNKVVTKPHHETVIPKGEEISGNELLVKQSSEFTKLSENSDFEENDVLGKELESSVSSHLLNLAENAVTTATFLQNGSSVEYIEMDETAIMTEGGEIAFLQEMPTSNFEFLIDAQTARNALLTELLSSQSVMIVEEDDEFTTFYDGEEISTLEFDFSLNEGNGSELEILLNEELHNSTRQKSLQNEIEGVEIKLNEDFLNSVETDGNSENTEKMVPECPDPGWCIFWFLSQDTCAVNGHCLGSRICCKTGCSKTCIDV